MSKEYFQYSLSAKLSKNYQTVGVEVVYGREKLLGEDTITLTNNVRKIARAQFQLAVNEAHDLLSTELKEKKR